MATLF